MAERFISDGGLALRFVERRMPWGRILVATGTDGSLYCHGPVSRDSPPCAWRQTRDGDRQWLAFDVRDQSQGTGSCRAMAGLVARGEPHVVMDWPLPGSDGTLSARRTPVRVVRDGDGVSFLPVAHGAEPYRIEARRLPAFLAGAERPRVPGFDAVPGEAAVALLVAMRDAPRLLTPGERLKAGAGMVALASTVGRDGPGRALLGRCLERFVSALGPMLDAHRPNARMLGHAAEALRVLRAAPAEVLGPRGRAWLVGEAAPALGVLEGRLRAREVEIARWAEVEAAPAPAFA